MKVLVKVVMNQAEINKANETNSQNEQKRNFYKANPEAEKETITDVKVPKPDIKKQPMLFDLAKVEMATIGDAGMIQIVYDGRAINTDYDEEVWKQIESRFDEQTNNYFNNCRNMTCSCKN